MTPIERRRGTGPQATKPEVLNMSDCPRLSRVDVERHASAAKRIRIYGMRGGRIESPSPRNDAQLGTAYAVAAEHCGDDELASYMRSYAAASLERVQKRQPEPERPAVVNRGGRSGREAIEKWFRDRGM